MPRRKREPDSSGGRNCREKPQQRNAANARERARMRILSRHGPLVSAEGRQKPLIPQLLARITVIWRAKRRLLFIPIVRATTMLSNEWTLRKNTWPRYFVESTPEYEEFYCGEVAPYV